MIARLRVFGQAIYPRAGFLNAHVCENATTPVIAARSLRRPCAPAGAVEMIAHIVPVELGCLAAYLVAASGSCGTPASLPASAASVVSVVSLSFPPVAVRPSAGPLVERSAFLQSLRPSLLCLSG